MAWKGDSVTVTGSAATAEFEPHPDGQFVARCVDVIDLGENVEQFENFPPKLVQKMALVFVTGEAREFNGEMELIPLVKEFSKSMGEKAALRKFATSWRGKSYTPEEIAAGVNFDKMLGAFAVITVEHKVSQKGRTYANILSVSPVMKGVAKPEALGTEYTRPKFLTDKKAQYAEAAKKFKADAGMPQNGAPSKGSDFTKPPKFEDDSSLPF